MAVQYAFSQITTTGLKLAVDAADPLSYPGSGTTWTDVTGNGFTGTISSSISFATTNRGALVSSNSASAVSFSGSAADFGQGSFTIEMAFSPSQINGRHWLYSKNSGSFPNFGAFITGSGGSGRITAFYNVSSTVSSSATTAVGSIVTGSNYVLDVTYIPSSVITSVYLNSNYIASGSANGTGSLSTSASLLLLNNTTASSAGTMGNLYNFKIYNPYIGSANIRKNYNSMCSRFGLPLALYTPPTPFLLDIYAGAAAAYSLRLLRTSYTGNAIRVRRTPDNTEQDIGFDGDGNLNTGALLTFCGVGNGFVTTWYDQSGNGRNAVQTTATNQPQIINGGIIITQGTKPALQFDGINDIMTYTDNGALNSVRREAFTYIGVIRNTRTSGSLWDAALHLAVSATDGQGALGMQFTGSGQPIMNFHNSWIAATSTASIDITSILTNPLLVFQTRNGSGTGGGNNATVTNNINNLSATGTQTWVANSGSLLMIGSQSPTATINVNNWSGSMQEFVIYSSDQSSNRTPLSLNINSYYSIY